MIRRVLLILSALGVAAPIPSDPSPCQLGDNRRGDGDADVDGDVDSDTDVDGDADVSDCEVCIDTTEFDNVACTVQCGNTADCGDAGCSECECREVHDYRGGRDVRVCVSGGEPPYLPFGPRCGSDSECAAYLICP